MASGVGAVVSYSTQLLIMRSGVRIRLAATWKKEKNVGHLIDYYKKRLFPV